MKKLATAVAGAALLAAACGLDAMAQDAPPGNAVVVTDTGTGLGIGASSSAPGRAGTNVGAPGAPGGPGGQDGAAGASASGNNAGEGPSPAAAARQGATAQRTAAQRSAADERRQRAREMQQLVQENQRFGDAVDQLHD